MEVIGPCCCLTGKPGEGVWQRARERSGLLAEAANGDDCSRAASSVVDGDRDAGEIV